MLPPTMPQLLQPETRPYFAWWSGITVAELHAALHSSDLDLRAYWMGTLLREANTRDVWIFVTPEEILELWPRLLRHLGRARSRWAFLMGLPEPVWPPEISHAG